MGFGNHARVLFALIGAVLAIGLTGCGGDDKPSNSETNPGAPPGATGEEAGGFAVEAGKQRDPKDVQEEKENFSPEPPPVQIQTGDTTGYRVNKPTAIFARTQKEFNAMKKEHFSNGVKRQAMAPIDFKTRQITGLFLPSQAKGTLLSITDIHEEDGKVVVKAVLLLRGKGCKTAPYKPRPFHMVETRQLKGEPKVILEKMKSSPC